MATDYNLVIALENGRSCEDRVIGNAFNRLKKKAALPDVVFHSLRHSSTTYKLREISKQHRAIRVTLSPTWSPRSTPISWTKTGK